LVIANTSYNKTPDKMTFIYKYFIDVECVGIINLHG